MLYEVITGLDAGLEGEEGDTGNPFASGDKRDLNLPGLQEQVLRTAYESGKPVVLVVLSGSALAIQWADEHLPAILQGWYPGAQGGRAIAEAIFGEFSPEGKLPITVITSYSIHYTKLYEYTCSTSPPAMLPSFLIVVVTDTPSSIIRS